MSKVNDLRVVTDRMDLLDTLAKRARELGIKPRDGVCFTPWELDELRETRQLMGLAPSNMRQNESH